VGLGKCCCLRSLAARVAAVAAYAWARGTLGRQPIREGEEKKTRLDIFLEPLEIGEIKGLWSEHGCENLWERFS